MALGELIENLLTPVINIFDMLLNKGWGKYILIGIILFGIYALFFVK